MSNPPSASSRPIAAAKSRKNLLKQQSSIGGTSHTQPGDRTPLPAAPSNAQFSFTFGTSSAEGSSLPTAPGALSNGDNARFSFTSGTGTLPAEESSLPSASVAFGNKRKAQFESGVMPEIESSLLAEPLVFGMQSDALSFTSGTVPAEWSPLPAAPSVSGTQSYAQPALDFGTQPEEESIEKLVADLEAEMARSEGLSAHTQLSHDTNYGLDMTFGLDTDFVPAVPNVGQDSNATHYPDPSDLESGFSLPYFAQDSNIQDRDLPYSSFIPGHDIAQDPFTQDPYAQDPFSQDPSFDQELNFPLDPSFDLTNEPSNYPSFAASTQPPDPSVSQDSDRNVQDNTRLLPSFIQDSSIRDPYLPYASFSQDPTFIPGLELAHDPFALDPFGLDPFSLDPFGLDPFAQDPSTQDPSAQDPSAQDPSFDQELNFPLDPIFDLPYEPSNYPPIAASIQPPDPGATQYSDPNAHDNTHSLPYFIKDSSMTDLDSPHSTFHQDANFIPGPDITQDPIAQDPSFDRKRNFPLDPSFHLANEPSNYPTFTANAQPRDPSTSQYPDPKLQDMTRPLPYFIQDSSMSDPDLPHSTFHQDARLIPGPNITQDPIAQDPVAQDFVAQDPVAQDPVAQDPVAKDPVAQDPVAQDPVAKDPVAQDPVAQDFVSQDPVAQDRSLFLLDPNLDLANEKIPKANEEEKRSTVTSGTSLPSEISIPATTIGQVVTIDQREIQRLRAEIERKNKVISDKNDKIKRSTRELQDQDTENKHLIKQFRGDLDKLRIEKSTLEKSTLEKANHSLARENSETKENQGKAEKDTELIRKLNCELGRIRKKQSALVKANESLAKDYSDLRAESDKLCESNSILKEENCLLRSSLDDHRTSRSELVEAKETIRAQEAEIQNSAQKIAALSACIDEISPKLLWRTEELQEAEECVLHEESVSKYYRDRCSLLWNKCNALEAAGDSRDTEFAKLEMEEEQRHTKELEALNLQIRDLEVANKRLAQRAGNVGGSADIQEVDKVDEKIRELPLPEGRLDENQEPPKTDEEPLKKSLRLRQEELKAQRKEKAKERFEQGKALKLRAAHQARPEEVAALSIPVEDSGPQDGTPATPNSSAPVVPKADEARGEEGTTAQTAPPTRSLFHNIWSMILWYKGLSHKWEWAFLALFIILVLVVGIIGAYLSYLDAVITILDEAVDVVPLMVERGMPAVAVRRYMQRGLGAAGVPGL